MCFVHPCDKCAAASVQSGSLPLPPIARILYSYIAFVSTALLHNSYLYTVYIAGLATRVLKHGTEIATGI